MNVWNLLERKLDQEKTIISEISSETRVILVGDTRAQVCSQLSSKSVVPTDAERSSEAGISYRFVSVSSLNGNKVLEL